VVRQMCEGKPPRGGDGKEFESQEESGKGGLHGGRETAEAIT
jgi:hypothetical protein